MAHLASFIFFPDQVSKLGKLKYKNENDSVQDVKADDLRQMFLAMTEEVIFFFYLFDDVFMEGNVLTKWFPF